MEVNNMRCTLIFLAIFCSAFVKGQEQIPPSTGCGKNLTSKDTVISSPNDPNFNRNCTWKFNTTDPQLQNVNIFFTFSDLLMVNGDSLTVKNNNGTYSKVFNSTRDSFVMMVDSSAVITYVSSITKGRRGFTAKISLNSSGTQDYPTGSVGVLRYPLFLSKLQDKTNVTCTWTFHMAALSFRTFNLSKGSNIIITSPASSIVNGNYTGTDLPPDSVAEDITVSLVTTTADTKSDFEIDFLPVTEGCSGVQEITHPTIFSNPQPQFLIEHQDCVIVLKNSKGLLKASLSMDFQDVHDSIVINTGSRRFSSNIFTATKQQTDKVAYLLSDDHYMWVEFSSEQINPYSSFNLTVEPIVSGGLIRDAGSFQADNKQMETASALMVSEKEQVFVQITYNLTKGDDVTVYDDLIGKQVLLQLNDSAGSVDILGNTNQMLVVSNLKAKDSVVNGSFEGKPSGCNRYSMESSNSYTFAQISDSCTWIVKPKTVQATDDIMEFSIPSFSSDVEITMYEGISLSKKPLLKIEGSQVPKSGLKVHVTAVQGATITYQATKENPQQHLTISYRTYPACVKTFDVQSSPARITTPNYPDLYPINAHCKWTVNVPPKKLVHIVFNELSLNPTSSLQIYKTASKLKVIDYSGFTLPDDVIVDSSVTLIWTSSAAELSNTAAHGFDLTWKSLDCGGNYTDVKGNFSISNIPQPTTASLSCVWAISNSYEEENAPYISLSFSKIPVTKPGEILKFHDGGSVRDPVITPAINKLTSKTTKLLITYDIPAKTNSSSYNFSYSKQDCKQYRCDSTGYCLQPEWLCNGYNECGDYSDEKYCSPEFTDCGFNKTNIDKDFQLKSNLINQTGRAVNCKWTLETSSFQSFLITISNINLQNENDLLKIEDSKSKDTPLHIASYLIQTKDDYIVTSGNSVTIHFFSSHFNKNISVFNLQIHPQEFGRRIISPETLQLNKSVNQNKGTFVFTGTNQVLFNLSETITKDTEISFYDGTSKRTPLAIFDSNSKPYPVFSMLSEMLVEVKVNKTLKLEASVQDVAGCNEIQMENKGYFATEALSTHEKCTWLIKRPLEAEQGILILNIETIADSTVTVFDHLDANSTLLQLNSSWLLPYTVHIPYKDGVRIEVDKISTNDNTPGIVKVSYEVIPECSEVYNVTSHVDISSPGYPHLYPFNADCKWTFHIPEGKRLYIQFIDIDLEKDHKVIIGQNHTIHGVYSGQVLPDDIVLDNKTTFINWSSKNSTNNVGRGFKVLVEVIDCGGNVNAEKDSFSTPSQLNKTTYCVWMVDVSEKDSKTKDTNIIQYKIDTKATGKNLEIHDGGRMTNSSLSIKSGEERMSRTNKLIVKYFYQTYNKTGPSFELSYSTFGCNETCKNGICMQSNWKCNGYNDCGDFTDEYNCTRTEPAPTPQQPSGVSTGWFVAGLFLALAIGIIGTLLVPRLVSRYRRGGGHQRLLNESES